MSTKKILITGSKGFIGHHIYHFMLSKGYCVISADVVVDYVTPFYFKVSDPSLDWKNILLQHPDIQVCINAAGAASAPASIIDPHNDFLSNTYLVHQLLEAIRAVNNQIYLITLSSAAVYGNPSQLPIGESMNCLPLSPYGYHKLMAEQLCEEYSRCFQIRCGILRIFSAYGEGLHKQLFWDLNLKSINSFSVELYGTGNETRDFIYIQDICSATWILTELQTQTIEIFNLASGVEVSIREAATLFYKTLNWNGKIHFNGEVRDGDPINWRADISKILDLGWRPIVNLNQGLEKYVRWLKELK